MEILKWFCLGALALVSMSWRSGTDMQLLLNCLICAGATLAGYRTVRERRFAWGAAFSTIAILFNPWIPIEMPLRGMFIALVAASFSTFAFSLLAFAGQPLTSAAYMAPRRARRS